MLNDGKKTNYYNIEPDDTGTVDVDRIASELDLTFAEGNVLKALFGIAIARKTGNSRHVGTGSQRDANKLYHYAEQIRQKENR
jgi:hypothetical protein